MNLKDYPYDFIILAKIIKRALSGIRGNSNI